MRLTCRYPNDPNNIDLLRLEKMGGVGCIVSLYKTIRTPNVSDNLFVVILDFIVLRLTVANKITFSTGAVLIVQYSNHLWHRTALVDV